MQEQKERGVEVLMTKEIWKQLNNNTKSNDLRVEEIKEEQIEIKDKKKNMFYKK